MNFTNAKDAYQNLDEFIEGFHPNRTVNVYMRVYASACNGSPILNVKADKIFDSVMLDGMHELSYEVPGDIVIGMDGKSNRDTIVDEKGNIIDDKYIAFESLSVDGVELLDTNYFYNETKYYEEGNLLDKAQPGFWKNSELHINIDRWFQPNFVKSIGLSYFTPEVEFDHLRKRIDTVLSKLY